MKYYLYNHNFYYKINTMPNYCYNTLKISCDNHDKIKVFFNENKSLNNKDKNDDSFLSFAKSVPKPESEEDWYNWNCNNWGTKWEAIDVELNCYSDSILSNDFTLPDNSTEIIYTFSTAWGPALNWLDTVAKKYPDLYLENEYSECGMDFYGKRCYANGEIVDDIQQTLSLYNWDKVDKRAIIKIIKKKLEEDTGSPIEDLAEEIFEEYADNNEYFDNISCYIEDEIEKIRLEMQKIDDSLTLNYDNEGNKVNILEF